MSDPIGELRAANNEVAAAITETIQNARQGQAAAQEGLGTTLAPTPILAGQNGAVDDGREYHTEVSAPQVKHLPGGGVSWGKKLAWLPMPLGYEGMSVRVWVNYPNKFDTDIQSRDQEVMRSALKRIFIEHNGWVTPEELELAESEGRAPCPMSAPTTDVFWEEAPNELVGAMILLLNRETIKLPNSLMQNRRS